MLSDEMQRRVKMGSRLTDDEGEGEIDQGGQALPGGPRLQRLHFRRVQPRQRAPRPSCKKQSRHINFEGSRDR